jgi:hypothetical protein
VNGWQQQEVQNGTHFRDFNEWTEAANDEAAGHHATDAYICECGDASCTDPINLTRQEYESVRSEATHFAIATNHENPELDRVLAEHSRYTVVEKWLGEAARIAYASNPRR